MNRELAKIALRIIGIDFDVEARNGYDTLNRDDIRIALEAAYEAGRRNPLPTYADSFGEARSNDW